MVSSNLFRRTACLFISLVWLVNGLENIPYGSHTSESYLFTAGGDRAVLDVIMLHFFTMAFYTNKFVRLEAALSDASEFSRLISTYYVRIRQGLQLHIVATKIPTARWHSIRNDEMVYIFEKWRKIYSSPKTHWSGSRMRDNNNSLKNRKPCNSQMWLYSSRFETFQSSRSRRETIWFDRFKQ